MSCEDCLPSRRHGVPLWVFTTSNFHFVRHSRPLHNGVKSPTAFGRSRSGPDSNGYVIDGHRESLLS
jgi:hypothetical protein